MSAEEYQANFGALVGPGFVGLFFNLLVSGMVLVQSWDYFILYHSTDNLRTKISAAVILGVTLITSATEVSVTWDQFIAHFGDLPRLLEHVPKQNYVYSFLMPLVSTSVQLFFVHRTWQVGHSLPVAWGCCILVLVSCVTGVTMSIVSLTSRSLEWVKFTRMYFWASGAVNTFNSVSFVIALRNRTSQSGTPSTEAPLLRLLDLFLQSATWITLISLAGAVLSLLKGKSGAVDLIFSFVILPSYASSYLHALNSRKELRLVLEGSDSASVTTKDTGVTGGRAQELDVGVLEGVTVRLETFRVEEDRIYGEEEDKGRNGNVTFTPV